ncbi:hypothetical protein [Loigolactobacillus coryniformis]|uniref:Uncharacterized protein n=1 Tax=Loigolactobacillus coryniformis subsp. torquens DSM 20004 = KCTC 3535 TaxID=1423822 RepID=A0A2D1KRR4_9LACO|nr:hypothetical protein [Loigolactobacillus coryniformis]ATO44823.1 hypothetical protein LC20004_13365 [Loigolactobacillus coryniformis subsp. torquens DSM 20004 = KCTC 3535]
MKLAQGRLSEVEIANVETPKVARIVSISKSPRYGENGEPIPNSVAKVVCQFIDTDLAKIVEKAGGDASQLKVFVLELVGDETDLVDISESELLGSEIQLTDAKVMLKWATGRNGGGWRDLKLVMNISNGDSKAAKR